MGPNQSFTISKMGTIFFLSTFWNFLWLLHFSIADEKNVQISAKIVVQIKILLLTTSGVCVDPRYKCYMLIMVSKN